MMVAAYNRIRHFRRMSRRYVTRRWKQGLVWHCILGIVGLFTLNLVYQIARKPGEIFAPISTSFAKSPASTWGSYGALFEKHSTTIVSPDFLAALAQAESDGNPIASTPWRWQWSWNLFDIYRPASSAAGMFQITDGTFAEARKYCIREHTVLAEGPWYDLDSCWFNGLYTRTVPSHAVEMTAAYLHRRVVATLVAHRVANVSLAQKQKLAAVIHLCGVKRGEIFASRNFQVAPGERCGAHSLQRYLTKIDRLKNHFARLRKPV
jgi:hypothetical protein